METSLKLPKLILTFDIFKYTCSNSLKNYFSVIFININHETLMMSLNMDLEWNQQVKQQFKAKSKGIAWYLGYIFHHETVNKLIVTSPICSNWKN